VKISPYIRGQHKGQRSLTQVSRQIRIEFLPLYSSNLFQHTYSSATALKKYLQCFLGTFPKNSKIKIVIFLELVYAALDFLRIFKLIDATCWEELEVSFRCEDKHSTIAETINRAIQQRSSWQGSILQVERIRLYHYNDTRLTVHLVDDYGNSRQDRDERKSASNVWSGLGFAVR
jgi:hypothetical protein